MKTESDVVKAAHALCSFMKCMGRLASVGKAKTARALILAAQSALDETLNQIEGNR